MYVQGHLYSIKKYTAFRPGCIINLQIFFLQYNASRLVTLSDDDIVSEASLHLIKCIQDFEGATVIQKSVKRSPKSVINFLPGELIS